MVARTGAVEASALAAGASLATAASEAAGASVGAGVGSSDRQAITTKVPATTSADQVASRARRFRLRSKDPSLLQV